MDFNISGKCSGGLSMTSFFNTNLSNDSNAMRTANLVSIRVIRGGKKLTHSIALDKFVRFVFKVGSIN